MHLQSGAGNNSVALVYHPSVLQHETGDHPEYPGRVRAILDELGRHGIGAGDFITPSPVDRDILTRVHDTRYVDEVAAIARAGGGFWDSETVISPSTFDAVVLAAGAATTAVDLVMEGTQSAFAIVRPPGHHALFASAMGFCFFNNVAIAAERAIYTHGLERVMIIDWDVHHGNGTQDYFYERSDVLFLSTHQYPFYPGTGAASETGTGEGAGYTINVPLPAGVGDAGYLQVFDEIVAPAARSYRPQLLVVSAGYDAHIADPLGGMAVTVAGFYEMARRVRQLADEIDECEGRLAAVLEGGYNVQALALSVAATIAALDSSSQSAAVPDATEGGTTYFRYGNGRTNVTHVLEKVKQIHNL